MLLDEYLRITISKKISEILPIILKNVKEKPFDKTTLNYQNYADFLYGEIIGFLNGYLAGIVTTLYGINQSQAFLMKYIKLMKIMRRK